MTSAKKDGDEEGQDGEAESGGDDKNVTKEKFFASFKEERDAIRQSLSKVTAGDRVNEELDSLLTRVQALEESFTRIAHILPAYDVQQYQSQTKELSGEIAAQRDRLAPRKKFSFKKKAPSSSSTTKSAGDLASGAAGGAAADGAAGGASRDASRGKSLDATTGAVAGVAVGAADGVAAGQTSASGVADMGEVFEGLRNQAVARSAGELDGQDVTLRGLDGCLVLLLGRIGALHCHDLQRCQIYVGAVSSSALLYGCSDCAIGLATKQLRLHDSSGMLFHLHTLSGPVIEHCKRIAFAPFDLSYPGLERHLSEAALGTPSADPGAWSDVQDFNWHKRQASPNWCILPAECRRERVCLSTAQAAVQGAALPSLLPELERCRSCWDAPAPASAPVASAAPSPPAAAGSKAIPARAPGASGLDSDDEF